MFIFEDVQLGTVDNDNLFSDVLHCHSAKALCSGAMMRNGKCGTIYSSSYSIKMWGTPRPAPGSRSMSVAEKQSENQLRKKKKKIKIVLIKMVFNRWRSTLTQLDHSLLAAF
ncbi:hypothetical protein CEXT_712651 [Caerostris extrusa]|uniref:Uncharacterized protein n=1 Tax=Caerostris extrusa TaxID=172846 RepID=A0AAV4WVN7_CAEEX|nr:hypothetical protein CEXT_712651 [Caerostris extrusa]